MISLHKIREIVEDRLDYCLKALPSPLDAKIKNRNSIELRGMIKAYQFILSEIRIIEELGPMEGDIVDNTQNKTQSQ